MTSLIFTKTHLEEAILAYNKAQSGMEKEINEEWLSKYGYKPQYVIQEAAVRLVKNWEDLSTMVSAWDARRNTPTQRYKKIVKNLIGAVNV